MSMEAPVKYTCPICEKVFSSLNEFSSHVMQHADEERKAKEEHEKLMKKQEKERDENQLKELYENYKESSKKFFTARDNYLKKYHAPSAWVINAILNDIFA